MEKRGGSMKGRGNFLLFLPCSIEGVERIDRHLVKGLYCIKWRGGGNFLHFLLDHCSIEGEGVTS